MGGRTCMGSAAAHLGCPHVPKRGEVGPEEVCGVPALPFAVYVQEQLPPGCLLAALHDGRGGGRCVWGACLSGDDTKGVADRQPPSAQKAGKRGGLGGSEGGAARVRRVALAEAPAGRGESRRALRTLCRPRCADQAAHLAFVPLGDHWEAQLHALGAHLLVQGADHVRHPQLLHQQHPAAAAGARGGERGNKGRRAVETGAAETGAAAAVRGSRQLLWELKAAPALGAAAAAAAAHLWVKSKKALLPKVTNNMDCLLVAAAAPPPAAPAACAAAPSLAAPPSERARRPSRLPPPAGGPATGSLSPAKVSPPSQCRCLCRRGQHESLRSVAGRPSQGQAVDEHAPTDGCAGRQVPSRHAVHAPSGPVAKPLPALPLPPARLHRRKGQVQREQQRCHADGQRTPPRRLLCHRAAPLLGRRRQPLGHGAQPCGATVVNRWTCCGVQRRLRPPPQRWTRFHECRLAWLPAPLASPQLTVA